MPQYLVANYLADDFDPSTVTEAMIEEIHALNREMIAAGVRKFACGISPAAFPRPPTPRRCGSSPTARWSSPTGRTWRPRSTSAVFGYWKPPIWTRYSRGRARVPSPAIRWARCANFYSYRTRREQRNRNAIFDTCFEYDDHLRARRALGWAWGAKRWSPAGHRLRCLRFGIPNRSN